jgi:DNA-binding NtrC family response regulator
MEPKIRILVVDDDPVVRRSCERVLGQAHEVVFCETGHEGLEQLASQSFDAALVDLKLPDVSGMDILAQAPDRFPDVPIVIITGYSTIKTAVDAIKLGASDYVAKPFTPDELEAAVEKAIRQRRLLTEYRQLQNALEDHRGIGPLIGESREMKRVFALIDQVAQTDSTVFLTGESGTGKDRVARAIHFSSRRKSAPFVAVDCGAVAPTLIASELFGHVRGAFTGATASRNGLIRTADGGTLFLDEIANLPLDCQTSLLRVMEEREVRAVGASASQKVDVRFIVATNQNLEDLVKENSFREDLFYRLNVFPIRLPSLRERPGDIPLLARHFLAVFSARMHKKIDGFTPEALDALKQYEWPGNVRELSNVVERSVILTSSSRVGAARLHDSLSFAAPVSGVPQTVDELSEAKRKLRDHAVMEIERAFLTEALRRNDYNVTKAAQETGMQRTHFQSLLKKHGLRIKDLVTRER